MSLAAIPVRSIDSSTTDRASTVASVSLKVPLMLVPMAVRQAETMTASGMALPSENLTQTTGTDPNRTTCAVCLRRYTPAR